MKRRLIVACGSGVATSQTIASKIAGMLEDDGLITSRSKMNCRRQEFMCMLHSQMMKYWKKRLS